MNLKDFILKNKYIFICFVFFIIFITTLNKRNINSELFVNIYKVINNNFIKKVVSLCDNSIEIFLLKFNYNHQAYWSKPDIEDNRKKFSDYIFIDSEKTPTLNNAPNEKNFTNWERSHGNNNSNKFSDLDLINKTNISQLEVAWIYNSKDGKKDIQCNPVVVDGNIYTPTAGGHIVSLNGATGNELWRSEKYLESNVARRGIVYWPGNKDFNPRIIFSADNKLISLDAKTGVPIKTFGKNGKVKTGINLGAPIIYKNYIIIATFGKKVEAYNLFNGKFIWDLKFRKNISTRFGGVKYNNQGGNPWGGYSADINRGILFVTTGNPHDYFDGTRRPGKNDDTNSIIAIDLEKKKKIWSFQETSHDLWNQDIAAPPIVTSIKRDSKLIDVVIAPTKRGNTLVLDRLTGKPIFNYRLKKAPSSSIPGEKTSWYQPDLILPEPFSKNIFSIKDISPDNKSININDYSFGFYKAYAINKKNIQYNFIGGATWVGASVDHENNIMYVPANNIPIEAELKLKEANKNRAPVYYSHFKRLLDNDKKPITNPPYGTISAINLNSGKIVWSVTFGQYPNENNVFKTGTENFGGLLATKGGIIIATGTLDKKVYAYDSHSGKELWNFTLPFIGSAPPATYLANNEQYFIVQSTGSITLKQGYGDLVEFGDALVAFKIKK